MGLKEVINRLPYWLKCSFLTIFIIFLISLVVSMVIMLVGGGECFTGIATTHSLKSFEACFTVTIPQLFIVAPALISKIISRSLYGTLFNKTIFLAIINAIIFWFAIGSVVGLIYGKVKSRRKVSTDLEIQKEENT